MSRRLALLLLLSPMTISADSQSTVNLDSISYADLTRELKGLKGQVVLVDVWGMFCAPCREKFPQVVDLHRKYAKSGLAVLSVSVDPPDDRDARAAAHKFLTQQQATFRNVILTDAAEHWQARWKVEGPPIYFLFDREGRLVQQWNEKIDISEIEKRIAATLRE